MFISNGGNNRLAGIMLAAATFGVMVAGPGMIGFVPIMVVGALIFYLGIALLEEALYDTFGKMNRLEYLTVTFTSFWSVHGFANVYTIRFWSSFSSWASTISSPEYSLGSCSPA